MGFDKSLITFTLHYNDSTIQNTPTETLNFKIYISKHCISILVELFKTIGRRYVTASEYLVPGWWHCIEPGEDVA